MFARPVGRLMWIPWICSEGLFSGTNCSVVLVAAIDASVMSFQLLAAGLNLSC